MAEKAMFEEHYRLHIKQNYTKRQLTFAKKKVIHEFAFLCFTSLTTSTEKFLSLSLSLSLFLYFDVIQSFVTKKELEFFNIRHYKCLL